jgi:hypothetical protein
MKRDFYHEYRAVSGGNQAVANMGIGSWARKGISTWVLIEEPQYFPRGSDDVRPMLIYTAAWGSVYLIYEYNKHLPGEVDNSFVPAYPAVAAVIAEGTKAELWDLFIALGRMEVSK